MVNMVNEEKRSAPGDYWIKFATVSTASAGTHIQSEGCDGGVKLHVDISGDAHHAISHAKRLSNPITIKTLRAVADLNPFLKAIITNPPPARVLTGY